MATGDGIIKYGDYATVQAEASVADTQVSSGAVTNIATALPGEKDYFLLDFKVIVSTVVPTTRNLTVDIFRNPAGAPVPTVDYLHQYVGSVIVDLATGEYFLRGVPNSDSSDTFYVRNALGLTTTLELQARGRTYISEA